MTQVKETGAGGRVLKAFTYATANGTGDYRLGKLQVARGYNHVVIGATPCTVGLAETYVYGGKQGRVSSRATQTYVNGGAGEWRGLDFVDTDRSPRMGREESTDGRDATAVQRGVQA